MLTSELINQVLTTIPNRTVGLLGDLFLDRYLDIDPARDEPSVETGKVAYQVTRVRSYPGALGTVMNNLAALGVGRIYPITIVGDDGEGYELMQALRRMPSVELGGIVTTPERRTPTYTKPMYGTEELNRLDIKNRTPTPKTLEDSVLEFLDEAWPQLDALIVLDQVSEEDCGVVTGRVRDRLAELGAEWPDKFVLADSRDQIGKFRSVCIKPNSDEMRKLILQEPVYTSGKAAEIMASQADILGRFIFCTIGMHGMYVVSPNQLDLDSKIQNVPAYPVTGPIDICGAGDSTSAGITSAMVAGFTHEQAAAFGNLVASITIQQLGTTGTASPEQVRKRWKEVSGLAGA